MTWVHRKLKGLCGRMLILLVLLSFGGMTGYSALLHNHDFDLGSTHDDCAACQWVQAHQIDNSHTAETAETPSTHAIEYRAYRLEFKSVHFGFDSRGPPVFS